ncbi:Cullin-3, partial [Actinomortierella ambigua]
MLNRAVHGGFNAIPSSANEGENGHGTHLAAVIGGTKFGVANCPEERPNTYVYDTDFQPAFLAQSTNFYRIESENLIRHSDAPEYMRKVESRLQEERERCSHYLAERTEPEVRSIVEVEMIEKHLKTIMDMENSGLRQMLINNRVEVLLLFNDVPEGVALGYEAIAQETGLPLEHLKRTLQSVACGGKYKILIKEPKSRNIADTDTFTFNRGFSEKMSRIKIQT